jgi:hypothetical protein
MAEHQLPKLMSAVFDHSLAGCFSLGKRGSGLVKSRLSIVIPTFSR